MKYSFIRYLAAKKTVDDRALNRQVWQALVDTLPPAADGQAHRVLEIGAGIGVMLGRMLEWNLASRMDYLGIDAQPENIVEAQARLPAWAQTHGYQSTASHPNGLRLARGERQAAVRFEAIDLFDWIRRERRQEEARSPWDLLIAHAFLDLVDLPSSLPQILALLRPAGVFYFTINFDDLTVLEPAVDPAFDELVNSLYHRSMNERRIAGRLSGDSRTGRHLFEQLRATEAEILAAGASDWVVFSHQGAYPADEAYFLHHLIWFFEDTLHGHPELDPHRFAAWLKARHAQIERGELVYIAHQLDFVGRMPK